MFPLRFKLKVRCSDLIRTKTRFAWVQLFRLVCWVATSLALPAQARAI